MKVPVRFVSISMICICTLMVATFANSATVKTYDLVINNGRVMDPETHYDAVANVGIKDGKIAIITQDKIEGNETIDATGLVVAPGFIDAHFHGVDPFATKLALRDGITTAMDLEAGATHIEEWYEKKATSGWQVNYGTTYGALFSRLFVHDPEVQVGEPIDASNMGPYLHEADKDGVSGWSVTRSSIDQMNEIMKHIDEGLRQGALGVAVPAAYASLGLTTYEQFEVQRTAARYGRVTTVHGRFHLHTQTPTEAQTGFNEVLVNAMLLDAPLLYCHDNDYGWWENEEKLKIARDKGYNVWGEYYPFASGSTIVSATFLQPDIWEDVHGNMYEETIYDPGANKFLSKDEFLELVKTNPGYYVVLNFPEREKWMTHWLTIPHMVVASDGVEGVDKDGKPLPWEADVTKFAGHPRTASTFATTLRMARENNVPLMFTLSQLSYWSAKHLGDTGLEAMKERGRVQVGKVADLTLFNPETVTGRATFKTGENGLPSEGIPYVIVNGTMVVKNSEVLPVKPGQPIRFPVEKRGSFKPLSVDKWLSDYTISTQPLPPIDEPCIGNTRPRFREDDTE